MQLQRLPGASSALGSQQQKLGRHQTCRVAASSAAVATPEARTAPSNQQAQKRAGITSAEQLPAHLRNAVAVLQAPNAAAPGGSVPVFVLGMSHVSQASCEAVRELITAVQPDVVMVELCKDRVGLLVDPEGPGTLADTWHCRRVLFEGVPWLSSRKEDQQAAKADDVPWPTRAELRSLLNVQPGRPVSTADIENDVRTLLATGLFARARPACENASFSDAPEFGIERSEDGPQLRVIPPLGTTRFVLAERELPRISEISARVDSSLRDAGVSQEALDEACAAAMADVAAGIAPLRVYLRLRGRLLALFGEGQQARVMFTGVEGGKPEVLLRAPRANDPAYLTGLEGSAEGGEGMGIEAFRPMRNSVPLSPRMLLPQEAVDRLSARRREDSRKALAAPGDWQPSTESRPWTEEEVAAAAALDREPPLPPAPVVDTFGALLTRAYGRIQAGAGERVGIRPGAAWRAALEAAADVGAQQLLLGDRPASVSQRRLADGIFPAAAGRAAAALGVITAGIVTAATPSLSDALPSLGDLAVGGPGVVAGAFAAAGALMWPVIGPFVEVWRFAKLEGPEIEAAVAINEPLQGGDLSKPLKLFGEDALLDWPNAIPRVIDERDAYMARVLAAAAAGKAASAPAYVATAVGGQLLWRLMMSEDAPVRAAPKGLGDGEYAPVEVPRAVVGVVGSAHVRGMCREWEKAVAAAGDVEQLLEV